MITRGRVLVIGGGIVGVCTANYLLRAGFSVEVVDPLVAGSAGQCSFGNSGIISSGTFVPNATPGLLGRLPGMLTDREGPLSLRKRYLPTALPWLLRFLISSRQATTRQIAAALYSITSQTYDAYEPLLKDAGCEDLLQARGLMILYESVAGASAGGFGFDLRREYGVAMETLDDRQVHELEPGIGPLMKSGVLFNGSRFCPNPGRLVASLAALAQRRGAIFLQDSVVGFDPGPRGIESVRLASGTVRAVDHVVLAAGSRSGKLARMLGTRVPIEHERGYHIMVTCSQPPLTRAIVAAERAMTVTPMEGGLRFTGTEEFAGADAPPDLRRTDLLARSARRIFPDLDLSDHTTWMGRRPGMPDSKPVIDRSTRHPNVLFAFGHGHQGMIGAAVTGRLVAQLAAHETPSIDLTPFRADRFWRLGRVRKHTSDAAIRP